MLFLRGIIGKHTERIRIYSLMRGLQNCLEAGNVSFCGITQQSRPYQWVVGFCQQSSAHEQLSGTRLQLVRPLSTLLRCNCLSPNQLNVYPCNPLLTVIRFRRRRMSIKKSDETQQTSADDEAEETDEEDDSDNTDISSIAFQEDSLLTSNYRELTTHLKSTRLDAVISAGLGLPRNQVEDLFLASQLRLNGERLQKKSLQLDEGDYIDYVFTDDEGATKLKRVRVLKVEDTGNPGDKLKIYLRAWRSPQDP